MESSKNLFQFFRVAARITPKSSSIVFFLFKEICLRAGQTISFFIHDPQNGFTIACQNIEEYQYSLESEHFNILSGAAGSGHLWKPSLLHEQFRVCVGFEYVVL